MSVLFVLVSKHLAGFGAVFEAKDARKCCHFVSLSGLFIVIHINLKEYGSVPNFAGLVVEVVHDLLAVATPFGHEVNKDRLGTSVLELVLERSMVFNNFKSHIYGLYL